MKSKILVVIGIILFFAVCFIGLNYMEDYEKVYYTKVDNTKIQKLSTQDNMKYEYTLDCYSKEGKKKEFKFKTSRELKEGAYLLLEVRTFGVHKWQEVKYEELPIKVQKELK